jgi:hypothetical protein
MLFGESMEEHSFRHSSNVCLIQLIPSRIFITRLCCSRSCDLWLVRDYDSTVWPYAVKAQRTKTVTSQVTCSESVMRHLG